MRVRKAGHIYELDVLDGDGKPVVLTFVCREAHLGIHPGVQTQEVLRAITELLTFTAETVSEMQEMLIDRTNHCDSCLPWQGNERVIKALSESARQARLALLIHEQRALERDFERGYIDPATVPVGPNGHYEFVRGGAQDEGVRLERVRYLLNEEFDGITVYLDGQPGPGYRNRRSLQDRRKGLTSRPQDRPLVDRGEERRRGTFHPDHGWNKLGNLKIP